MTPRNRHAEFNRKRRNQADYVERKRLYDCAAWRKKREYIIASRVFCEDCKARGRLVAGTEVNHRVDLARGGAELDDKNLQLLCHACHSYRTKSGGRMKGCGLDGVPFARSRK